MVRGYPLHSRYYFFWSQPTVLFSSNELSIRRWSYLHRNHIRKGLRVPSNIVPAVTDVCHWQIIQRICRLAVSQPLELPQDGQINPVANAVATSTLRRPLRLKTIRQIPDLFADNPHRQQNARDKLSRPWPNYIATRAKWIPVLCNYSYFRKSLTNLHAPAKL